MFKKLQAAKVRPPKLSSIRKPVEEFRTVPPEFLQMANFLSKG